MEKIWNELVVKGESALKNCKTTPVGFYSAGLMGERLSETEIVEEGNCGGAYIVLTDSRSPFIKWLKENKASEVSKNMGKGYVLSLSEMHKGYTGQSAERYEACAEAVATILKENGIECRVRAYLT